eukprot:CAMPEP_0197056462 /NCGR_PEP_ID=MMETSP1384-20130603/85008_1 /TAXON_ID=29189 /ORGANISM="Ammonia sp." /LENGTH=383 /DNA_ID=CAMNT_0042490465 /DNA_START=93 /DNA_END=1241 /DNA_ORIENTATION=+
MKSAIVSLLLFSKQTLGSGSSWDYHTPAHWADTYTMCDNEDESPIDIITEDCVHDESVCTADFEWDIDLTHTTFKIKNNGHSIGLTAVESTSIDPDNDLDGTLTDSNGTEYIVLNEMDTTIATFPNYFLPEHSEHDTFCLDGFHFHWGTEDSTGSEHLVDGTQYPLEVHFVHYSCAHASLGSMISQFPDEETVNSLKDDDEDVHQLAVVGIFFDVVEGESNPAFDAIFEQLEAVTLPTGDETIIATGVDLSELIPEDVTTAGYYAYEGSLTTPPCTNIARWHVMNSHGWIGAEQMEKFRALLSEADTQIAPNYRPVQANVNTVYACMEEIVEVDDPVIRAVVWVIAIISMITPIVMGVVCCWMANKEKREAAENAKATSVNKQ